MKRLALLLCLAASPAYSQQCAPLDTVIRGLPPLTKYQLYSGVALTRARYSVYEALGVLPTAERILVLEFADGRLFVAFVHDYSICMNLLVENRRQFERDILGDIA